MIIPKEKTICVYSRSMIELIRPYNDDPHLIISIVSGEGEQANLPICKATVDVLRLHFHDADVAQEKTILFNEEMAKQILNFLFVKNNEVPLLLIHCDAGYSRSPAIAAAVDKITRGDDSHWFKTKAPNRLVLTTLLNTYNDQESN